MMRRSGIGFLLVLFIGGVVLLQGATGLTQMGPGKMRGLGATDHRQTSVMPMKEMSEVIRQMADRLASRRRLDAEKGRRLRRLADQLATATARMSEGMGGSMMGGGMMGGRMMEQGPQQMAEVSRILAQISNLLRSQ